MMIILLILVVPLLIGAGVYKVAIWQRFDRPALLAVAVAGIGIANLLLGIVAALIAVGYVSVADA